MLDEKDRRCSLAIVEIGGFNDWLLKLLGEYGCRETVLCTPPRRDGSADPAVLFAARATGVQRVFVLGGAQAIAAMALGAGGVPRCAKLYGPGNAYVTEAKQQVAARGVCGTRGFGRAGGVGFGQGQRFGFGPGRVIPGVSFGIRGEQSASTFDCEWLGARLSLWAGR